MTGIEDLLAKSKVHSQPEPLERIANALELVALEASAIRVLVAKQMRATVKLTEMVARDLDPCDLDDDDDV